MTEKVDEKFELRSEKEKGKGEQTDAREIRRLMAMAGIDKKMEGNKEGDIDFNGLLTGVADGQIRVKEDISEEDIDMLSRLAGLNEKKLKRSIFSKDSECDRFSMFKEMEESASYADMRKVADVHDGMSVYHPVYKSGTVVGEEGDKVLVDFGYAEGAQPVGRNHLYVNEAVVEATGTEDEKEEVDEAPLQPLHQIDPPKGNVYTGPWGKGGENDPRVRDPERAALGEPDSAEVLDKFYEFFDPDTDGSDAAMRTIDWVRDQFDIEEDYAVGIVHKAFEDGGLNLPAALGGNRAANEDEVDEARKALPDQVAWAEKILGTKLPDDISAEELSKVVRSALIQKYERMSGEKVPPSATTKEVHGMIKKYLSGRGIQIENGMDVDEVSPPGWKKTVKKMKKHKEIDNPFALAWHMKNKGHKPSEGVSEEEIERQLEIEEAMKDSEFKEGSLHRLMVEMIVDEMKKGKTPEEISEELSFDPDEVFYVVEFFQDKKVEEDKEEEEVKEQMTESNEEENEDLERVRYLTEYKNTK